MENGAKKSIFVVITVLVILAVGAGAFGIRYKTVPMEDKVLMIERWTGRAVFVYSDGSSNLVASTRSVRGPLMTPKRSSTYEGVQLRAKLKWHSGKTHYQISVQPYNDALMKARKNSKAYIVVDLLDRRGFMVKTLWIPVRKMRTVKNDAGEVISLEYGAGVSMCIQDFKDIRGWKVR
jgi:hypothetical protein